MVRTRINQSGQQVRAVIEGQPILIESSGTNIKISLNEHSGLNVITSVIDGDVLDTLDLKNLDMNDRLDNIVFELRKINMQLSLLTDAEIKEYDVV